MQRVSFYIDGYNFYRGLRDKQWQRYYWLDMVKFCTQFLKPHQTLVEVNYFSAIPKGKGKQERFDSFLTANKQNPLFNLLLGKFMEKTIAHGDIVIKTFEEKQTDVHIAVKMIRDVVLDKCDCTVLISADSDLTPPIDFLREYKPKHRIYVYFPPNRFSYDLKQKANSFIHLQNHQLKFDNSILPDTILISEGFSLRRPEKWR
jgi:uncharacterized LabA/DUF88 family protein